MEYELYIDVFFGVNFCMNLGLLLALRKILKAESSVCRLVPASLAGAAAACVWAAVPSPFSALSGTFLAPLVMIWIGFRPSGVRELAKETLTLWSLAVCIGGIMDFLCGRTIVGYYLAELLQGNPGKGMPILIWLFGALGTFFLFRYVWLTMTGIRREKEHLRRVELLNGDFRIRAVGFLDTGNRLCEPESGKPVHIISGRLWRKLLTSDSLVRRIPYRTIGSPAGMMEIMEIDAVRYSDSDPPEMPLRHPLRLKGLLKPEKEQQQPPCRGVWVGRAPFPVSEDGSYEILLHEEQ